MLWLCLERLSDCPEIQDLDLHVYVDCHDAIRTAPPKAEVEGVLAKFSYLPIQVFFRAAHPYDGNTYNVMMAYAEAYARDSEFVYLVEDDVMVDPNFFAWHQKAQRQGEAKWFCSIGSRCLKNSTPYGDDYVLASGYASIGVCFKRENLAAIVEHANPHYFRHMSSYIGTALKDSRADQYTEQDGLIERIIAKMRAPVIWPTRETSVCHHVGYYGYHRWNSARPQGALEKRYEFLKVAIGDPERLRGLAKNVSDVESVTR